MAWSTDMVTMLRVLINDLDNANYIYTDGRLQQMLVVGGMYVYQELPFDVVYSFNIATPSISPDPTLNGDTAFVNLTVLKSACLADISTFRTKALSAGIVAHAGPASLSTVGNLAGFKDILNMGPCAAYQLFKNDYRFGDSSICKAILSPFCSNDFDPESLSLGYTERESLNI